MANFALAERLPTSATLHLLNSISRDDENYTYIYLSTPTNNLCFRSLPTIFGVLLVFLDSLIILELEALHSSDASPIKYRNKGYLPFETPIKTTFIRFSNIRLSSTALKCVCVCICACVHMCV